VEEAHESGQSTPGSPQQQFGGAVAGSSYANALYDDELATRQQHIFDPAASSAKGLTGDSVPLFVDGRGLDSSRAGENGLASDDVSFRARAWDACPAPRTTATTATSATHAVIRLVPRIVCCWRDKQPWRRTVGTYRKMQRMVSLRVEYFGKLRVVRGRVVRGRPYDVRGTTPSDAPRVERQYTDVQTATEAHQEEQRRRRGEKVLKEARLR
jgi:hypothetical protein